jgi:hypothetical protein
MKPKTLSLRWQTSVLREQGSKEDISISALSREMMVVELNISLI